jgi:hypothetical protein
MAPSNVPTNWKRLLLEGIYQMAAADPRVPRRVEDALTEMTKDPESLYSVLGIIFYHSSHRQSGVTSVDLKLDPVISEVRSAIELHRPRLQAIHPDWMGNTNDTLWDEVDRMARLIETRFNVQILAAHE